MRSLKAPLVPPAATGIQIVRPYEPSQNELNFIADLRRAVENDEIDELQASLIECDQLRKVSGKVDIRLTAAERELITQIAKAHNLKPRFME